ncbi:MAG: hypothetical protein LUO98_06765 [Methanoregula sp.]|nr:hypothetical protein [Methanoregula sp.]
MRDGNVKECRLICSLQRIPGSLQGKGHPARTAGTARTGLLPSDPDHDGIYGDIKGNDRKDFGDIALFFEHLDRIGGYQPSGAFDPNGKGWVEFDDIVVLFMEM